MKLLQLQPSIHQFESFAEFSNEFLLNEHDILVVNDSIYSRFIRSLELGCPVISPKKYGDGEPTDEIINQVIAEAKQYEYQRVIAIGGGAVMDIAKFLVLEGISDCLDVFENRGPFNKTKSLIAIPTTCGTGSEVTAISVAEIKSRNTKMGTAIPEFYPDDAVLIPELLRNMPYKVFIFSAIDALVHAAESYVSPRSNCYTELFAEKAIEMILKGLLELEDNGCEYYSDIIDTFLIGSNYAGIAFGNAGVGVVHALAYPLGTEYHVAHGECNYEFFTPVFRRYTERQPEGKIEKFNQLVANIIKVESDEVYDRLDSLFNSVWQKQPLRSFGMKESEIADFAKNVVTNQQKLIGNSYVALSEDEMASIYNDTY